jgi:hypothetical protein
MTRGRAGTPTSTHHKRNGTTTLFAALDALDGTVIRQGVDRHRHQEFLRFLRTIDREVPKGLAVHLILDNYANPQTQRRKDLADQASPLPAALHPDLIVLAEPGRAVVSRADRQGHQARDLPPRTGPDRRDREVHGRPQRPAQPLVWTATAESILANVRRGRVPLNQAVSQ